MRHLMILLLIATASIAFANEAAKTSPPVTKTALFAGGCFWCMQPAFDRTPGVVSTMVGYTGGAAATATYAQVSSGTTGHVEAIQVTYDPAKTRYETLLETYWENIDPTDADGQFADHGSQYHTAIFYADDAQHQAAELSKKAIAAKFTPQPIVVQILPAKPFYAAEQYHQKYYEKNAAHYDAYKHGSGRADYLQKTWNSKSE